MYQRMQIPGLSFKREIRVRYLINMFIQISSGTSKGQWGSRTGVKWAHKAPPLHALPTAVTTGMTQILSLYLTKKYVERTNTWELCFLHQKCRKAGKCWLKSFLLGLFFKKKKIHTQTTVTYCLSVPAKLPLAMWSLQENAKMFFSQFLEWQCRRQRHPHGLGSCG